MLSRSENGMHEPKPICLWSGPRNVSTALMYSFRQHPDVRVVDEPLYAHYLRVSGALHPGRDAVLAVMDSDGDAVMRALLATPQPPRLFLKQMAHHAIDLDLDFLPQTDHVLLIRDPRDMLPSLTVQLPEATLKDTGLDRQGQLYERIAATGRPPAVVDSRILLEDPPRVLGRLCRHLALEFDPAMLGWPEGPKPEDGVWAPHWYQAVHRSTGFAAYRPKPPVPGRLQSLYEQAQPYYERLRAHAIGEDS